MSYCVQKPKSLKLMNIKKKILNKNKKIDDLHFLPNNILTIFFKELTIYRYIYIYKRITINNI